jgi:hypothetical protein
MMSNWRYHFEIVRNQKFKEDPLLEMICMVLRVIISEDNAVDVPKMQFLNYDPTNESPRNSYGGS